MEATFESPSHTDRSAGSDGAASSLSSAQPPQKRNRAQLSCTSCRTAKLKCDRKKPCSQCTKKGNASLCTFPSRVPRRKPAASMQNRLKHLESLVKDVMTGQSPSAQHDNDSEPKRKGVSTLATTNGRAIPGENVAEVHDAGPSLASTGQVLLGSGESTYVGATHWAAILEDVCLSKMLRQSAYKLISLDR